MPRLLVVEDDSLLAFEIEDILRGASYDVVGPAGTVAKALRLIETEDLHGAFLDCNLRGEPATAVAQKLAAKKIPFVVVTGFEQETLPPDFGNGIFARKPFTVARILELARTISSDVGD